MKKLGYIVSKKKIKNVVDFVGVVNSVEDIDDPTKPFIIIGLNEAKEISPNFSILNKVLDVDVFWTFGKTEKRTEHERDLENFYKYVLDKSGTKIKAEEPNATNKKTKIIFELEPMTVNHFVIEYR